MDVDAPPASDAANVSVDANQLRNHVSEFLKTADLASVTRRALREKMIELHGYQFDDDSAQLLATIAAEEMSKLLPPAEEDEDDGTVQPSEDAAAPPSAKKEKKEKKKSKKEKKHRKKHGADDDDGADSNDAADDDVSGDDDDLSRKRKETASSRTVAPKKRAASSSSSSASAPSSSSSSSSSSSKSKPAVTPGAWPVSAQTAVTDTVSADDLLMDIIQLRETTRRDAAQLLTSYCRANDLYISSNKIECDAKMKACFGSDTLTENQLHKGTLKHLFRGDGTSLDQPPKKKERKNPDAPKKPASLLILSDKLAAFLGHDRLTRGQVVSMITAYVKENKLNQGRIIHFDAKMQEVFGCAKSDWFKINALLTKHLWKESEQ